MTATCVVRSTGYGKAEPCHASNGGRNGDGGRPLHGLCQHSQDEQHCEGQQPG